ncbi:DNA-3-methyladenine glycosylase [Specibacter sp. NPDC057265]|uniref:DNA-3-methyladenine glycosylase n=1 Tax=Specibacter sp. NPDC057265 TaxID=3346075 RepID=UPI0036380528
MSQNGELWELVQKPATEVGPALLGAVLRHESPAGAVAVRLTEVEAYLGPADSPDPDPGAHSFRGKTNRNAVMFGPPAHLYVYFTYGMHFCANLVCRPEGISSGCLMRAGEIVEGLELARSRRPTARHDHELAQGPARLTKALGLDLRHNGISALGGTVTVTLPESPVAQVQTGPRVGVSGPGGTAQYPWRFWIDGDKTVSKFRPAVIRAPR